MKVTLLGTVDAEVGDEKRGSLDPVIAHLQLTSIYVASVKELTQPVSNFIFSWNIYCIRIEIYIPSVLISRIIFLHILILHKSSFACLLCITLFLESLAISFSICSPKIFFQPPYIQHFYLFIY